MILDFTVYNNSLTYWMLAGGITIAVYLVARLAKAIVVKQLRKLVSKADNSWTNNSVKVVERIHSVFLLIAGVFFGSTVLALPDPVVVILRKCFFIAVLIQVGLLLSQLIDSLIENYRTARLKKNAAAVTMLSSASLLLRIFMWSILLILALDNFGVNITSLVAGLGVGGIAVALAVQNVLGKASSSPIRPSCFMSKGNPNPETVRSTTASSRRKMMTCPFSVCRIRSCGTANYRVALIAPSARM